MSIVTKERFVKKELFAGGVFTSKSNVVANFGHQSFYDILMSFEICGGDFEEMVEKVRTEHGWIDTSPSNKSIESEGAKSPEKFLGEDPPENINDVEEQARPSEVIDLDEEMEKVPTQKSTATASSSSGVKLISNNAQPATSNTQR